MKHRGKIRKALLLFSIFLLFVGAESIPSSAMAETFPVAYYPFTGNANDKSGYENDASSSGATPCEDRFTVSNSAYCFDGDDDKMDANPSATLSRSNFQDGYTITAWIKPAVLISTGYQSIVELKYFDVYPLTAFNIRLNNNMIEACQTETDGSAGCLASTPTITTGSWYHVAVTWDKESNDMLIFKNGGIVAGPSDFIDLTQSGSDSGLVIGYDYFYNDDAYGINPRSHFNGTIDEVTIYSRALSPLEIRQNMCSGRGGDIDGDGVCSLDDNCQFVYNPFQEDGDVDGVGDACELSVTDTDGDGVYDSVDNCPYTPNVDQADRDEDGTGNACEGEVTVELKLYNAGCHGAGHYNSGGGSRTLLLNPDYSSVTLTRACFDDNGYITVNGHLVYTNSDGDCSAGCDNVSIDVTSLVHAGENIIFGHADDSCGSCADVIAKFRISGRPDLDGDGILDDEDNCPLDVNPLQEDSDGDEDGDVCDPAAMGTPTQQPTGDVVISASTGAVFVDVTVTLKPIDLDGDGPLDDTYYVKPDPYNVVPKLFPCGGGAEISADQVLCGPPCSLPNDLVLVTAEGGPQDFTTTIELTQWFTRLAPGCYNVRAEYVNFCRDLDFDTSTGSCKDTDDPTNGCYTGIWQGKKDLEVVKGLVLEASQTVDQCPTLPGSAGDTGCPYADKNVVMLHTVSLGKCLWKLNWEKEPLAGVSVRVFDRKNPAFLAVAGRSNPNSSLYGVIFEANQGRVGACTTDANGVCYAGEGLKGYYLVIIRFTDPETGSTVYVGRPKDPCDYDSSGIDVKHFQIMKVYKDGLFKEYRGGRLTVVEGSILELIEPESAVWDGNSSIYPFIFTSDSNWSVDVCAKVPAGYRIVGVYDTNGNLTRSSECAQAFVNGETKTIGFEVLETGSPEPSLNATLTLKSPKGKKVTKEVKASDVRKKTFKKWLSQAKAKSKR